MSTNIRTFEYSFDRLIFEYEIDIRIFGYIFLKEEFIPVLSLLFNCCYQTVCSRLILCLRKGSIGHYYLCHVNDRTYYPSAYMQIHQYVSGVFFITFLFIFILGSMILEDRHTSKIEIQQRCKRENIRNSVKCSLHKTTFKLLRNVNIRPVEPCKEQIPESSKYLEITKIVGIFCRGY